MNVFERTLALFVGLGCLFIAATLAGVPEPILVSLEIPWVVWFLASVVMGFSGVLILTACTMIPRPVPVKEEGR